MPAGNRDAAVRAAGDGRAWRLLSRAGSAANVVHPDFGAKSAKGTGDLKSGDSVIERHWVPAMQAESTGNGEKPIRLVRPMGPELPQPWIQFVGRWQPARQWVPGGLVHRKMLAHFMRRPEV